MILIELHESLEDLEAVGLTFFGVELGCEEIALSYHRTELSSVITFQCNDGGIAGSHKKAVNKVKV